MSSSVVTLYAFYFIAAIALWLGLLSLRRGVRFVRYLQAELGRELPDFTPFLTVFVPCRGLDDGLKENISALFIQDYPSFEIIFVSDRRDDPAFRVIEEARRSFAEETGPLIRTIVAGQAIDSGQKVHNLREAVKAADPQSEVFVFTDTDARTQPFWLRSLVAPLQDETIGATTGYRWFLTVKGGFASHLQSVWNAAIASALGKHGDQNFCWGGSTAIRRQTFEMLKMDQRWRGTVSDDFALSHALNEAGLPITFMPHCLTPSFDDCTFSKLVEFTTRQLRITRAYAPHLWKTVLIGSVIFTLAFFGGLALIVARAALGLPFATPLVLVSLLFLLGAVKSHLRLRAVALIIRDRRINQAAATWAHILLWPIASLLFLCNALAAFSRRITWRGITYELKSPVETVILARDRSKT